MEITLVLRSEKGSALTHAELDQNFENLKTAILSGGGGGGLQLVPITDGDIPYTASPGDIIDISAATAIPVVVIMPDPALCTAEIMIINRSDQTVELIQHTYTDIWMRQVGELLTANYSAITDGLPTEVLSMAPITDGYLFKTEQASIGDGSDQAP